MRHCWTFLEEVVYVTIGRQSNAFVSQNKTTLQKYSRVAEVGPISLTNYLCLWQLEWVSVVDNRHGLKCEYSSSKWWVAIELRVVLILFIFRLHRCSFRGTGTPIRSRRRALRSVHRYHCPATTLGQMCVLPDGRHSQAYCLWTKRRTTVAASLWSGS